MENLALSANLFEGMGTFLLGISLGYRGGLAYSGIIIIIAGFAKFSKKDYHIAGAI